MREAVVKQTAAFGILFIKMSYSLLLQAEFCIYPVFYANFSAYEKEEPARGSPFPKIYGDCRVDDLEFTSSSGFLCEAQVEQPEHPAQPPQSQPQPVLPCFLRMTDETMTPTTIRQAAMMMRISYQLMIYLLWTPPPLRARLHRAPPSRRRSPFSGGAFCSKARSPQPLPPRPQ